MLHLSSFVSGYSFAWEWLLKKPGSWRVLKLPARCFLLEHPTQGRILFDTGYGPRFLAATQKWPARLLRKLIPCQVLASAAELVGKVDRIILSHFHPDHVGSLRDFPEDVPVWCSREAYERRGGLLKGCLEQLLPARPRFHFIEDPDLLGDGSLVAVPLPGHAPGQLGLRSGSTLLCADAYYLRDESLHWIVRRTFADAAAQARTRERLLARTDVRLVACHDPEQAECERLWTSTP